ncbi:hypothetical protein EJC49_14305 [Aquibium carbonis]|uniref:Uncharacterized protein n=1 Tax=Aquibium carbonis TaxID=2495581 RepID=A0A3R9Y8R7_9HYPH|nr:hypothetical protein [Aquibium carbonis]RST85708.1 hypothetical protein EJC49_14305 [Aquibium carbonis]
MMGWKNRAGVFGLFVACMLALLASGSAAHAACDSASYDHNGSPMDVHVCDGRMVIEYDRPRSGIADQGVRPGTVLFRGRIHDLAGGARIDGRAHVFRRGCQPASFGVVGWMDDSGVITMEGRAPVRRSGCSVGGYRKVVLVFEAR